VAVRTESDEVFFRIISRLAPQLDVVHLQVGPASALLAAPAIPAQHLPTQFLVSFLIELDARPLAVRNGHAISARRPVRN
jgi:hypothetical protein